MKRKPTALGLVLAVIVSLLVAVPTAAHAALATQPDWRDFPLLSQGRYPNSNLVRFWQRIVHADVYTGMTCAQFVDGGFGPNTDAKTRTWQNTFKIGIDGSVGRQTWGTAQGHLRHDRTSFVDTVQNGSGTKAWFYYYYYVGKRSSFYVSFGAIDHYSNGLYKFTTYDPWDFHNCSGNWSTVSW